MELRKLTYIVAARSVNSVMNVMLTPWPRLMLNKPLKRWYHQRATRLRKVENVTVDWLGQAKKVVIDKDNTTIVEGEGQSEDVQARIKQIRTQIDETTSDYDREKLQERLAKLVGGVALIKVGAATETELKEKKARVEDAMHATKAAVEEGIVPGGGVALLRSMKTLTDLNLELISVNTRPNDDT